MGIFDFLKSGNDQRNTRCAICGKYMTIISNALVHSVIAMQSQGCFQCKACGRFTCFNCSDNREPCKCGKNNWMPKIYISHNRSW